MSEERGTTVDQWHSSQLIRLQNSSFVAQLTKGKIICYTPADHPESVWLNYTRVSPTGGSLFLSLKSLLLFTELLLSDEKMPCQQEGPAASAFGQIPVKEAYIPLHRIEKFRAVHDSSSCHGSYFPLSAHDIYGLQLSVNSVYNHLD